MIKLRTVLLIITVLFCSFQLCAQTNYEEFIDNNNIYKPGASWITLSYGKGYTFKQGDVETNGDISFHARIKNIHVQLGYHMSSNDFFLNYSNQRLNDLHLGIGVRKETQSYNAAFFAGPALSYGKTYYGTNALGQSLTLGFTEPGIFTSVQYTYKIYYDIGIGATLYASINKSYSVAGLQIHIYFSGAYKGKIDHD